MLAGYLALILADTDVLIDYLAGVESIKRQVTQYASADQLRTTPITIFELLSGAREDRRGEKVRQLVDLLETISFDRASAVAAAKVRRDLETKGMSIGMGDSLIAGIALENDMALFTRNRRHFERVAGLKLVAADDG